MGIEAPAAARPADGEDPAYPTALREREAKLIAHRRRRAEVAAADEKGEDPVGVCLSGGGIRSATFCLGVFQALARLRLTKRIDFLSTVSGGGYFGSFFGRLFVREFVAKSDDVAEVLTAERQSGVVRNLRENGRYLAPNGAGDALAAAAIIIRNWAALQVVLCAALMTVLLLPLVVVRAIEAVGKPPWLAAFLDTSPWLLPALVVGVGVAYPLGAAYWWLDGARKSVLGAALRAAVVPAVAAALLLGGTLRTFAAKSGSMAAQAPATEIVPLGQLLIPAALGVALGGAAAALGAAARALARRDAGGAHASDDAVLRGARRFLSERLATALAAGFTCALLGAIDAGGRTLYRILSEAESLPAAVGGVAAALAGVASFIRPIMSLVGIGGDEGTRPKLPVSLLAWAAALVVAGAIFLSGSVLAHAFANGFAPEPPAIRAIPVVERAWATAAAWCGFLALSVWFGRSRGFPNLSGQHLFYSARLTRAYVGASNPTRLGAKAKALTETCPGDDAAAAEYWRLPEAAVAEAKAAAAKSPAGAVAVDPEKRSPYDQGAPLHFVNVTVNETVDGRSQVQQQDRKGLGLAVGPFGVSLGVRHHVVNPWSDVGEAPRTFPEGSETHRAFAVSRTGGGRPTTSLGAATTASATPAANDAASAPQALSIGSWVGISGAAFSTGLGARTNAAMAFLCGLFNVRLGYWWNPGEKSDADRSASGRTASPLRRFLLAAFPAQTYVISEFLARFPGTAWPRWYLSDGGHFENMGGYELVRRRVKRIVMVDAEQDGDYRFQGLANFVRKARIDFGAEVRFLDAAELDALVDEDVRPLFGALEDLRRGEREEAPAGAAAVETPKLVVVESDPARRSLARCALARVRYAGDAAPGWLLYLKPTLLGDEPTDVIEYHSAHVAFPHETTGDQFFDEEQWESYRALGEFAASRVFAPRPPAGAAGGKEAPAASVPSADAKFRAADLFDRARPLP